MSIDKFLNNAVSLTAPVSNGFSMIANGAETILAGTLISEGWRPASLNRSRIKRLVVS
ncbi:MULTISPECIES: hypothetical protein [Pacificibacter]|uniref:hypothetical protein n=1 Tax=Pacificibacter TaxID=1042323 RepID=UPI001C087250|nr:MULTISPECIES: hypothetical protein [Pacificibacter]MBU2937403.1 hypothetical protein [Pacificibacter marinus]MDO6617045.1 hypothetical protein [Pacificibacter sp. 1_MG-2023]